MEEDVLPQQTIMNSDSVFANHQAENRAMSDLSSDSAAWDVTKKELKFQLQQYTCCCHREGTFYSKMQKKVFVNAVEELCQNV